ASWLTASFLLVNTALGVGILNFPAAYDQAGGIFYATLIQGCRFLNRERTLLTGQAERQAAATKMYALGPTQNCPHYEQPMRQQPPPFLRRYDQYSKMGP
ncbi:hypothetical protein AVEN_245136-1, partial [Araneus ventricosus]